MRVSEEDGKVRLSMRARRLIKGRGGSICGEDSVGAWQELDSEFRSRRKGTLMWRPIAASEGGPQNRGREVQVAGAQIGLRQSRGGLCERGKVGEEVGRAGKNSLMGGRKRNWAGKD